MNNIDIAEASRLDSALTDTQYIEYTIEKYQKGEITRQEMTQRCKAAINSLKHIFNEYA